MLSSATSSPSLPTESSDTRNLGMSQTRLSAALNGFVGSDGLLLYRGLGDDKEVSGWDVGLSRSVETPESRVREFLFDGGFLRKSLSGGFRYEFGQPGFAFGYGGYRHPSSVCVSLKKRTIKNYDMKYIYREKTVQNME